MILNTEIPTNLFSLHSFQSTSKEAFNSVPRQNLKYHFLALLPFCPSAEHGLENAF